jgi:hypothetical protein
VASCCVCGDETSGSYATELVSYTGIYSKPVTKSRLINCFPEISHKLQFIS